jgi:hypothetical protein
MHVNEFFRGLQTIPHSIPSLGISVDLLTGCCVVKPTIWMFPTIGAVIMNGSIDRMFGCSITTYPTGAGFLNPFIPWIFVANPHNIIS